MILIAWIQGESSFALWNNQLVVQPPPPPDHTEILRVEHKDTGMNPNVSGRQNPHILRESSMEQKIYKNDTNMKTNFRLTLFHYFST